MGWNVDRVNHTRNSCFFGGCFYNLEKTGSCSQAFDFMEIILIFPRNELCLGLVT